jgi:LPXTG-motif cell wall-anchored protein
VQTQKAVLSMPDATANDAAPPAMNAVTPSGEEVELSEIVESEVPSDEVVTRLPQTASPLPLFGLLGIMAIGAGLYFRRTARGVA